MKSFVRSVIPKWLLERYHKILALLAATWYRHPSRELTIIGVTGTNGKSTTVNLIGRILQHAGYSVGWTSTMNFKIGKREWLNDLKMTMPGRFLLQKMLRQMANEGCQYAVIETSSEGIAQSRHLGIDYDISVFTNLTPEHIESHGSFENYKAAKLKLFEHVEQRPKKVIGGKPIKRAIVVNADDTAAKDFVAFDVDDRIAVSIRVDGKIPAAEKLSNQCRAMTADMVEVGPEGSHFSIYGTEVNLKLLGEFNVSNALCAVAAVKLLGISVEQSAAALEMVIEMPGRVEFIDEGQSFKVLVDYAPEPVSLGKLYELLSFIPHRKLIHVLGSAGGGRDKARRSVLGQMAAEHADVVIVTNEDPYDEDPMEIVKAVAAGAEGAIESGKVKVAKEHVYEILDRRDALRLAVSLADASDLVLATGKGSEQAICVARGKKFPWDEREELRKALRALRVKES